MYIDPLWGGVVPRVNDILFSLFFPFGYLFVKLSIYYLITFGLVLFIDFLLQRLEVKENSLMGFNNFKIFLINGSIGFFFIPMLLVSLIFYIYQLILHFKCAFRKSNVKLFQTFVLCLFTIVIIAIPIIPTFFDVFKRLNFAIYFTYLYFILIGLSFAWCIFFKNTSIRFIQQKFSIKSIKTVGIVTYILFMVLFSSIFFFNTFGTVTSEKPNENNSQNNLNLSIGTYNIRYGFANEKNPADNWNIRKNYLAEYISDLNLDIIGIQEAYWFQLDYILKNTPNRKYLYVGFGRDDGVHGGEHSAILFDAEKYLLLDGDTFWFSTTPNYPSKTWGSTHNRICTWGLFEDMVSKKQFYLFNSHFEGGDEFGLKAVNLIHQKIEEFTANTPVFVMGDFNLHPTDISYNAFINSTVNKPLRDSFIVYHNDSNFFDYSVSNFNSNYIPDFAHRIDYIFISENINVKYFGIPKASYGINQTYSDHYPVLLNCTI